MGNAIFMKIEGLDGECIEANHTDWIDVEGMDLGMTQPVDRTHAGGRSAGRVVHDDISIVKRLDKSSGNIMLHCCKGEHFPEVVIESWQAGGTPYNYMKITLEKVMISSYTLSDSEGDSGKPVEQITLNYVKMNIIYTPLQEDGTQGAEMNNGWDVENNTEYIV